MPVLPLYSLYKLYENLIIMVNKIKKVFEQKLVTEFTWAANYTDVNERMGVISI